MVFLPELGRFIGGRRCKLGVGVLLRAVIPLRRKDLRGPLNTPGGVRDLLNLLGCVGFLNLSLGREAVRKVAGVVAAGGFRAVAVIDNRRADREVEVFGAIGRADVPGEVPLD